jgi:hypothetical protein
LYFDHAELIARKILKASLSKMASKYSLKFENLENVEVLINAAGQLANPS